VGTGRRRRTAAPTRPRRLGDRQAGALLAAGLGLLLLANAAAWRRERALARRLRAAPASPRAAPAAPPRVSILVAARDEARLIERHLASVRGLRYPNLEYVLCAGGADDTLARARRAAVGPMQVLVQEPGDGKQGALRRCLERASGEIVFLTDADCLLEDERFERVLAPVLDGRAVVATAPSDPLPEQRASDFVRHQWAAGVYARSLAPVDLPLLSGRNTAIRMDVLREVGGFTEPAPVGTDYHLARRLLARGYRIRLVRDGAVVTEYETGVLDYLRQQSRWLKAQWIHGRRFDAWRAMAPVARAYAIGVGFALLPCLAPALGRAAWALWAMGLAHALLHRLRQLRLSQIVADVPVSRSTWLSSAVYAPLDLLRLAYGVLDAALPGAERRW